MTGSSISKILSPWVLIVLVGFAAVLLSYPQPELQDVRQHAHDYMQQQHPQLDDDATKTKPSLSLEHPLRGLVVAVTGATSGIGLEVTRKLSQLGASKVIVFGRSPEKLKLLQEELPGVVETVEVDLSDLASVANSSEYVLQTYDRLDVLINNAGLHMGFKALWQKPVTKQGYDLVFGVNYLSHFLLTQKLLPLLEQSKSPKIVQISSSFHWGADGSDLRPHIVGSNSGRREEEEKVVIASQPGGSHGFVVSRSQRQYANSKLAQILHARSLQTMFPYLTAVSACPTWVGTQIVATNGSMTHSFFAHFAYPVNGYGLSSILHALLDTGTGTTRTSDDGNNMNDLDGGDFFVNTGWINSPNILDKMPFWMYKWLPIQDGLIFSSSMFLLLFQRFYPVRETRLSSTVSYDETLQQEFYEWSRRAVAEWL